VTTYVPFVPTTDQPFQFNATFDGSPYTVVVTVNFFRAPQPAYYINILAADGSLIVARPLIGSPSWIAAPLTTQQGNYIGATDVPYSYIGVGATIVSVNATPGTTVGFADGVALAMTAPAIATGTDANAQFSNDINLLAGYFRATTLVYRADTVTFEVGTYPPVPSADVSIPASPTYVPAVGQPTPALPPTSIFPPVELPPPLPNPLGTYLYDNGGALGLLPMANWPPLSGGLAPGAFYDNGGEAAIVPGITPNPAAPPIYFGLVTSAGLLLMGGGNLPTSDPDNLDQLWNDGGVVAISNR
jgi:hypothetical protein